MQDKSLKYHFIDIIYLYIFFIFSISVKSEEAYEIYNTTIINSHWLNHFITLGINNDAVNDDFSFSLNAPPDETFIKFVFPTPESPIKITFMSFSFFGRLLLFLD